MKRMSTINKLIYALSNKPKCYVEVKNPPKTVREKLSCPQEARQIQYNKWCRAKKVYNGSYLPKNKNDLLKKGWVNENNTVISNNKSTNPSDFYRRKSTNQWVRNDENEHWHWYNWWEKSSPTLFERHKKGIDVYLDKHGKPCNRNSDESHIYGK